MNCLFMARTPLLGPFPLYCKDRRTRDHVRFTSESRYDFSIFARARLENILDTVYISICLKSTFMDLTANVWISI